MLLDSSPPATEYYYYVTPIDTSAIAVLMQGARDLWHPNKPSLPAKVSDVRNKKHQLKNNLLSFMEEKELMWPEKEVSDVGEVFVQSLVDLLWYIDNHHSTFNERSHKIPPIFDRFTDCNMPQVHKHRKHSAENLSSVLLTDYSNKLFRCLQSCYWERSIYMEEFQDRYRDVS